MSLTSRPFAASGVLALLQSELGREAAKQALSSLQLRASVCGALMRGVFCRRVALRRAPSGGSSVLAWRAKNNTLSLLQRRGGVLDRLGVRDVMRMLCAVDRARRGLPWCLPWRRVISVLGTSKKVSSVQLTARGF